MVRGIFLIILLALSSLTMAQSREKSVPDDTGFPSSIQPASTKKYSEPKKPKKKSETKGTSYDARKEYDERMKKNLKERTKNFEKGETVDYSQPPYFGHKTPPKIRPIEKRKLCKVCGIKH